MTKRQYSEREVGRLLKRATELQDADPTHYGPGLTLDEIEQIARESGIDPKYIRSAAADPFSAKEPSKKFQWLGGPLYIENERILPGSLDDEKWARAIREVRRTYGTNGLASEVGATREWSDKGDLVETHVSIAPEDDRAHVRVGQRLTNIAAMMYTVAPMMMLMLLAAVLKKSVDASPLVEWMIFGGGMALTLAVLRHWFGAISRSADEKQTVLLSNLDELFMAVSTEESTEASTEALTEAPSQAAELLRSPPRESERIKLDESESNPEGLAALRARDRG